MFSLPSSKGVLLFSEEVMPTLRVEDDEEGGMDG